MGNFYDMILLNVDIFLLILVRISGIFIFAPVFSRNNLPMIMKIGLSFLISLILLPIVPEVSLIQSSNLYQLLFNILKEFSLGLIIGFICFLYFSVLYLAGMIVDTQIGFGMVNVMDPLTHSQMPIMGNFYSVLITLIFLAVNGHHLILKGLAYSFEIIPLGYSYVINLSFITRLTNLMAEIFILAFRFGAPVLISIFLVNLLLGILARTMPQMNVFIVGLPLKILIGFLTISITLRFIVPFSEGMFDRMFTTLHEFMQILARG